MTDINIPALFPYITEVPSCCGMDLIEGFDNCDMNGGGSERWTYDRSSLYGVPSKKRFLEKLDLIISIHKSGLHGSASTIRNVQKRGGAIVNLAQDVRDKGREINQVGNWHEVLIERGFTLVAEKIFNPNSGNYINTYVIDYKHDPDDYHSGDDYDDDYEDEDDDV